jgi:hypothetical protein
MIKFKEIYKIVNNNKITRTIGCAAKIFEQINDFNQKRTVWSALQAVASSTREIATYLSIDKSYHSEAGHVHVFPKQLNELFMDLLIKYYPYHDVYIDGSYEYNVGRSTIRFVNVDGVEASWVEYFDSTESKAEECIWSKPEDAKAIQEAVKKILWKEYENQSIVITVDKTANNNDKLAIEIDSLGLVLHSEKSEELTEYLRKFLVHHVNRSIMFYGPPGTGKSTLARTIVRNLSLRSIRFKTGDLDANKHLLKTIIDFFEPQAIILDDFDRLQIHNSSELLEILEYINQNIPLMFATVNDINQFQDAVIRPGRIDELIMIDFLDKKVICKLLGEFAASYEVVKEWPISFIEEYVKRAKLIGIEKAEIGMKELSKRVNKIMNAGSQKDGWNVLCDESESDNDNVCNLQP